MQKWPAGEPSPGVVEQPRGPLQSQVLHLSVGHCQSSDIEFEGRSDTDHDAPGNLTDILVDPFFLFAAAETDPYDIRIIAVNLCQHGSIVFGTETFFEWRTVAIDFQMGVLFLWLYE